MITSKGFKLPEGSKVLSIFFTAGYPRLHDTVEVLNRLAASGVDMVEVGFPFSDPVADGPVIQESNRISIENGMNLEVLFGQLENVRVKVSIPILLMGYLNPVERYGFERFLADAARVGVDGVILPDMPFDEYRERYREIFAKHKMKPVFLITPRTDDERIRAFDREAPAFLYLLSSDGVTGGSVTVSAEREAFFKRVSEMGLQSPCIVGFGVRDRATFESVTRFTSGAIIGSAFLKALAGAPSLAGDPSRSDFGSEETIEGFIGQIREAV